LLAKVGVQGDAKYVAFETVVQPENMPGVRSRVIDFPYVEGLRLDEAMHPLTMMATGLYGAPKAPMSAFQGSPRAKWTGHAGPISRVPTRRLSKRATRSSIFLAALAGPSRQGTSWFVDRD